MDWACVQERKCPHSKSSPQMDTIGGKKEKETQKRPDDGGRVRRKDGQYQYTWKTTEDRREWRATVEAGLWYKENQ